MIRHADNGAIRADIDRYQCSAHFAWTIADVVGRTIAQMTVLVPTPTDDSRVIEECATVL